MGKRIGFEHSSFFEKDGSPVGLTKNGLRSQNKIYY